MKGNNKNIKDCSLLSQNGFKEYPDWDYLAKRGVQRRVYLKRVGNDTVKVYQHERGYTFGILAEVNKPLCRRHGNAESIKEMNKTLSEWT
jgi:hypothetical protein